MTEEEARTKWCPHVRYVIDSPGVAYIGNRFEGHGLDVNCLCIASDCMMWRWDGKDCKANAEKRGGYNGYCGLSRGVS